MADQEVPAELLDRYRNVAVATVYGDVRRLGYEPCFMKDVQSFTPGAKLVGRARTLRFIPPRPDISRETHRGEDSPEYRAMGSCGLGDVLVCDAMGKRYAAIGDDDGIVVVPKQVAAEVIEWVEEHEQVEEYVKGLIESENVAPGRYYPISEETVRRFHESRGA